MEHDRQTGRQTDRRVCRGKAWHRAELLTDLPTDQQTNHPLEVAIRNLAEAQKESNFDFDFSRQLPEKGGAKEVDTEPGNVEAAFFFQRPR